MNVDLSQTTGMPHYLDAVNNKLSGINPTMLAMITVVIVLYYVIFSGLGVGTQPTMDGVAPQSGNAVLSFIEVVMWGLFIFLILVNGLQYFFQIDIKTAIRNIFSPVPEVDITVEKPGAEVEPEITYEKQVFHIPENVYTYEEADALCKAYGAELASYNQVEEAYNKGGEWCSYGWSADQLALFPTQKATYDKLQGIEGHKNDCGRPGVNGGFIDNPNVKFGVNCYGYKPDMTHEEQEMMHNTAPYPLTEKDKRLEKLVEKYRQEIPSILVSPFNKEKWSQV